MISRTVRYFKLMYIVAGILTSNEGICETVDKIQIAPRVEVKEILQPKNVYRGVEKVSRTVEKVSRNWLRNSYFFVVSRIKLHVTPILGIFSIWTIPNYLMDCSTHYISKRFIDSDCDMIYNK